METKTQEMLDTEIRQVKHLFFATIGDQNFLFINSEKEAAKTFILNEAFIAKMRDYFKNNP